jgi:hypothetical protein
MSEEQGKRLEGSLGVALTYRGERPSAGVMLRNNTSIMLAPEPFGDINNIPYLRTALVQVTIVGGESKVGEGTEWVGLVQPLPSVLVLARQLLAAANVYKGDPRLAEAERLIAAVQWGDTVGKGSIQRPVTG